MLTTIKMKKLRQSIADPTRFEESISLLTGSSSNANDGAVHSLTLASYNALLDKKEASITNEDVASFEKIVQLYAHPCLAIRQDGSILVANSAANAMLGAFVSGNIDSIGLTPCDDTSLKSQISVWGSSLQQNSPNKVISVELSGKSRILSLVMVAVDVGRKGPKHILAFLIDVAGSPALREKLGRDCNLTNNENDILELFVGGKSLAEIAVARGRSIATVRKQFYSVLDKFGVASQTKLLQEVFLKSNILLTAQPMLRQIQHPHRREVDVLRPHGRSVDVTLAGDMTGTPIIVVNSLLLRCFPARMEKMFKDAGLLIISLTAPCFGKTSPPLDEDEQVQCHAEDIAAVLDQLKIDKATMFATDYRFPASLISAHFIPNRLKQIVATNVILPPRYQNKENEETSFFNQLQRLTTSSDTMKSLVARIGARAFSILGPRCVLPILYRNNPELLNTYLETDNLTEIEASFRSVFAQGLKPAVRGFEYCNTDWSHLITSCEVPILLYEGSQGGIHTPETMHGFAYDFVDKIEYVELDCSLNNIVYGQPNHLISMMKSTISSPTRTLKCS